MKSLFGAGAFLRNKFSVRKPKPQPTAAGSPTASSGGKTFKMMTVAQIEAAEGQDEEEWEELDIRAIEAVRQLRHCFGLFVTSF